MAKYGSLKKRRRKQINRERRKYIAEYVRMFGPLPSADAEPEFSISPWMLKWHEEEREAKRLKAEADAVARPPG